jgi:hypothetical protein
LNDQHARKFFPKILMRPFNKPIADLYRVYAATPLLFDY